MLSSAAYAADNGIVVTPTTTNITLSGGTNATTFTYNDPDNSGTTSINSAAPHGAPGTSGASGSLQVNGDRSRYDIGSEYGGPSLGKLSDLTSFSFDYSVANNGSPNDYNTPAVRLTVIDGSVRSQIVFEGVYNGISNAEGMGWLSADAGTLYYLNVRTNRDTFSANHPGYTPDSTGVVLHDGQQVNATIADLGFLFSSDAYISGFSFGAGSGYGSDFVGYVDNVRIGLNGETNIINIEPNDGAAVPEASSWAMMIAGVGLAGFAARRRRKVAFAA